MYKEDCTYVEGTATAETDTVQTDTVRYGKGDSCYATVVGHNSKGSYLELDNSQRAFAYNAGNLSNGVRILCTIAKSATAERSALARLDSICSLYDCDYICA